MGLFTRKKKASPAASSSSSPISPAVSALASPVAPAAAPSLPLRVLVDTDPARDLFHIHVDADAPVAAIRNAVAAELGPGALGLYKVNIPWQAHYQARAYTARYGRRVDLIAAFPAFDLADAAQLARSLGPYAGSAGPGSLSAPADPTVRDWFPVPPPADVVSVLVRHLPLAGPSSAPSFAPSSAPAPPLTLVAHVALPALERTRANPNPAPVPRTHRAAPLVVDVDAASTVDDLKRALLRADGRAAGPATAAATAAATATATATAPVAGAARLDRVVLWRVEMSADEMLVIEDRGGLRRGKMPWPYPPTAAVPVQLDDGAAPVARYFVATGNAAYVNLSVWIHPAAAAAEFARTDADADADADTVPAPPFCYPMPVSADMPNPARLAAARSPRLHSNPPTPVLDVDLASPVLAAPSPAVSATDRRRARSRPSTAPASATPFGSSSSSSSASSSVSASSVASASSSSGRLHVPSLHVRTNSLRSPLARAIRPLSARPLCADPATQGLGIMTLAPAPAPADVGHARASTASTTSAGMSSTSSASSAVQGHRSVASSVSSVSTALDSPLSDDDAATAEFPFPPADAKAAALESPTTPTPNVARTPRAGAGDWAGSKYRDGRGATAMIAFA
ncbi:hypothetical protein Q5752_002124 [Cryptotrichosporon argae]